MSKTVTNERFAVQYMNHYHPGGKLCTLGNYEAWFDCLDIIRDLKQQGFDPKILRQEIVIAYGEWEAFEPETAVGVTARTERDH